MVRSVAAPRLARLVSGATATPPAYRSLARTIGLLVEDGRVPAGARLPSERELAAALGLSRTTITRTYALLAESGYATSRHGSGTTATLPDAGRGDGRGVARPAFLPFGAGSLEGRTRSEATPAAQDVDTLTSGDIDLTCATLPAPPEVAEAYEVALGRWSRHLSGSGYHPLGLPELRARLAETYTDRGLETAPEQIMVTSGAVGAHAILARAHLHTGDRVLVDSPIYPNGLDALRSAGIRPIAVPLDDDGWDLDAWRVGLRQSAPRAALLLPDYHNPTGALMSAADRQVLGRALTRHRVLGIVDETLVGTGLEGAAPPPFALTAEQTVTIGGASKSHWAGLRIGWVRAPLPLMAPLVAARTTLDLGSPILEQLALLVLLEQRTSLSAEVQADLRERRDALARELGRVLPEWRFTIPSGGMCLWVELPGALATPLALAAAPLGLHLTPGSRFAPEPGLERYVRLPFTAPVPVLVEAVRRLGLAWEQLDLRASATLPRPVIA